MQIEITALLLYLAAAFYYNVLQMNNDDKAICPICKNKLTDIQSCKTKYTI
jgi:hypothetical protein